MSRKTQHWILVNFAAAAFALCMALWLRYNGSNLLLVCAAVNFYLVYINVKAALRQ